ncbi:D-glycero-D-manno-heptose 1,7-bisphosphate phosphatase [hydrothermal vent metagenome]|uniref:D,D-heptose 1,7-bisphosphate phosphatase n=1 Tax=hydrothermal vent metagenome TaxID=652676 RepID=A0A3B1EA06_9ZZZZ
MKEKAVFLDRDGVINVEKNYLYRIKDFLFIDGVFDSLDYLQTNGYKLFIITNQSGIKRGYYTLRDFYKLTLWMLNEFKKREISISQVEFCQHSPSCNCTCRKPLTGMIDNILNKHNIDLKKSWLIGDKESDIKCAINANIGNTIQVKGGHPFNEEDSLADFVTPSIKNIELIIKS